MTDVNQQHMLEMRENIIGAMADLIIVAGDEHHLNVLVSEMMTPTREDQDPNYWMEKVFDAMRATITEYTRQMAAVGIQTATDASPQIAALVDAVNTKATVDSMNDELLREIDG